MLALLSAEAAQRGVPTCVLTFEPHPRDYFAQAESRPADTAIALPADLITRFNG